VFPTEKWKLDKRGCDKAREYYLSNILRNKNMYLGIDSNMVKKIFGNPDVRLTIDGTKEFQYILNCCSNDANGLKSAKLLVFIIGKQKVVGITSRISG